MHVLVKFEADYADEFDVYGLKICTKEEWDKFLNEHQEIVEYPEEWYFGSNEKLDYDSFKEFASCFNVTEISSEEYEILKKLIGEDYGNFPNFS